MQNGEKTVNDFLALLLPIIEDEFGGWDPQDRETIKHGVTRAVRAASVRGANLGRVTEAPAPAEYSPEIEARRAHYERLTEALICLTDLTGELVEPWPNRELLDIKGLDVKDRDHLIRGVDGHIQALWNDLDWYNESTLRKFYAELRLHADQLAAERHRVYEEHRKQEAA